MLKVFVLFIIVNYPSSGGGYPKVYFQEFNSQEKCHEAAKIARAHVKPPFPDEGRVAVHTYCLEK